MDEGFVWLVGVGLGWEVVLVVLVLWWVLEFSVGIF